MNKSTTGENITMIDATEKANLNSENRKKILVVNVCNPLSHGGAAIAVSLLKNLNSVIPEADVYLMPTRELDVSVYISKYGFDPESFVKHNWFKDKKSTLVSLFASLGTATWAFLSCSSFSLLSRLGIKTKNMYDEYDLVLDMSSDMLNEYYGTVYPIFSLFQLELILRCKKPVVVCPASIGPFKNRLLKRWVSSVLSKTDLVIAREETTLDFLKEVGVPEKKIYFAADLAFLFEPVAQSRSEEIVSSLGIIRSDRPLIGVATSSEIYRYCFPEISEAQGKYDEYVKLMAEATDFIIERFDVDVIFIPHFVFPDEFVKNDKIASKDIYSKVRNKERVKLLLDDYRADEVKGVIGLCDMLVSCRMHAAIAGTSSGVPTVALSFGHKFHSVLGKMLGQSKYIVKTDDAYSTVLENLKQTVADAWVNRASIHEDLDRKRVIVKEKALSSFYKIKELLYRD